MRALLAAAVFCAAACLAAAPVGAQTELGSEDDLTVLGTNGTALDPDAEIKGFTVFGSTQISYTGAVAGPGNVVVNGVLAVSSGAYFVGNSTFTGAGKIFVNDGTPGQLLRKNSGGYLEWSDTSAIGDNLGNHTATQDLDMTGKSLVNVASGTFSKGITVYSSATLIAQDTLPSALWVSTSAVTPHLYVSTSGNVGIGTANPSQALSIVAGKPKISLSGTSPDTLPGVNLTNDIGTALSIWKSGSATGWMDNRGVVYGGALTFVADGNDGGVGNAGDMWFLANNWGQWSSVPKMVLTGSGNVGISTNAPEGRLDIKAAGSTPAYMAQIWRKSDGVIVGSMSATGAMMAAKFIGDASGLTGVTATNIPASISVSTVNATAATPYGGVNITTNTFIQGNVGIGTTGPGAKLEVSGVTALKSTSSNPLNLYQFGSNAPSVMMFHANGTEAAPSQTLTGDVIGGINMFGYGTTGYSGGPHVRIRGIATEDNLGTTNRGTNLTFELVSTGGVTAQEKMRIASTGNVGIGTTEPAYRLVVSSGAGETGTILSVSTGTSTMIELQGDGDVIAKRFIGDGSQLTNLTGAADNLGNHVAATTLNMAGFQIKNVSSMTIVAPDTLASSLWVSTSAATPHLYVSTNGNVGIGTASPGSLLHVYGANPAVTVRGSGSDSAEINLQGNDGDWHLENQYVTGAETNLFRIYNGALSANAVTILRNSNNVGIGTATPQGRLDIKAAGSTPADMAQIWRDSGGTIVSSLSATGVMMASKFIGDGSGLANLTGAADNLGNHVATTTLQMGAYGVNTSSDITAARYQISGSNVLSTPGNYNVFVGKNAGYSHTSGSFNTLIGHSAGYSVGTSGNSTIIGYEAGYNNVAVGSVFLGYSAGYTNTSGSSNTFLGNVAGRYNTSGWGNLFVGYGAGYSNTTANANSLFGNLAAYYNQTGAANTILGYSAGMGVSDNSFSSSTLVGYQAGYSLRNGSADNIFVGFKAGYGVTTGTGNIIVGYNLNASAAAASNELNIGGVLFGRLDAKTVGISTRAPQAALDIVSTGTASNVYAQIWRNSAGAVVSSMTATGVLYPSVPANDNTKVAKAGDTMTGPLTLAGSTLTITGSAFSVGGSTLAVKYGNVGIGTANPASDLTVSGSDATIAIDNDSGSASFLRMSNYGTQRFIVDARGAGITLAAQETTPLLFQVAGDERMRIHSNGNVGISTNAPEGRLDIKAAGSAPADMAQIWRKSDGVIVSSMSATGVMMATKFIGDGSGITNLTGAADNLGNHVATTTLRMSDFAIVGVSSITANGGITTYSTLTVVGGGFSVAQTTFVVTGGKVGIGVSNPGNLLEVKDLIKFDTAGTNTKLGYRAGNLNTGTENLFVGHDSAGNVVGAGSYNTGVGYSTLRALTSGANNTAVGHQAGRVVNTGAYNVFVGDSAGNSLTSGQFNVFVGMNAGQNSVSVTNNVVIGAYAAISATGSDNTFVGGEAGRLNAAGIQNAVVGKDAGRGTASNTNSYNSLLGYRAGYQLSGGSSNTLVGFRAGDSLTTGAGNIILGYDQDASAPAASKELNVGGVLYGNLNDKTIGISTRAPQAALDIVSTGTAANQMAQIWRDGSGVIKGSMSATGYLQAVKFIGDGSGLSGISGGGDSLGTHIATQTLNLAFNDIANVSTMTVTGYVNVTSTSGFYQFGYPFTRMDVYGNSFLGFMSGLNMLAGTNADTFLGQAAGYMNTTGVENVFVGDQTGVYNTVGSRNTYLGSATGGYSVSGRNNSFVGFAAGLRNQTGSANVIVGSEAGYSQSNNSFSSSTLVGFRSGYSLISGSADNIFLGYQSGYVVTTGTGNIVIGYNQDTSAPAANNELNIGGVLYGDLDAKTIGISTRAPQAALDIVSTGTTVNDYAQIWRNSAGTIVSSMTATGVLYPQSTPAGDNLGNHNATTRLNMGNYAVWSSSDITAARYQINGSTVLALLGGDGLAVGSEAGINNTGTRNTFVGYQSGNYNTSGQRNTFVGYGSGRLNESGSRNVFMGHLSGEANTTGSYNSFIGYLAGNTNTVGTNNTYIGYYSGLSNMSGTGNAMFGANSGFLQTEGSANSVFGAYAGYGGSFSSSTLIGYQAGYSMQTGSADNILLGFKAGYAVTTGTGNIVIGYEEEPSAPDANNELNIGGILFGNMSSGNVGVGTNAPSAGLHVQKYADGAYTAVISTSATAGSYSVAVTSTGITNINNLVIENRTSDPVSPVTGQIWLRVD